jgi:hypothetical protein
MSRDKQIEEMAEAICGLKTSDGCLCDGGYCNHNCSAYEKAKHLYNAGYRKASEVAREIFEDIFYHTYYSHGRLIIEHSTLLALQKKYTESEKDNG